MNAPADSGLFRADGLACLRGGRMVFSGLSFSLDAGAALVVTGPNGSGKSSLLRVLAGLLRPLAGRLAWAGQAVDEDPGAHRRRLAFMGHADAVKPTLTVLDNLRFWAALADPREPAERARLALEAVGLAGRGGLPGRHLSAGQKRRLALARVIACPARLWLLDEPTVGLDEDGRTRLAAEIARHRAGGGVVVTATHAPLGLGGEARLGMDDFASAPGEATTAW
jgi:heme exporter protein A